MNILTLFLKDFFEVVTWVCVSLYQYSETYINFFSLETEDKYENMIKISLKTMKLK